MERKLTAEELDLAEAARIERDPSYRSARPGPRAQQAMIERDTREHQFTPHYGEPTDRRDENRATDDFSRMVQTAMLRNIVAAASELSQPGPYAVKATREKPITVRDKKGEVLYIDDGMSCKIPFNTTAAAPVPGTQNTFKLAAPKKRSEMSFAEAASTPASTFYAQIGEHSAIPSSTSPLSASFDQQTRPPQTFADALNTSSPIVAPAPVPLPTAKTTLAPRAHRIVQMTGPALELGLH